MPRTGTSLGPDGVEFVATALVRCRALMSDDELFRDQVSDHDAALTRILMRRTLAGERDVNDIASKAIHGLRLAVRLKELRGQ
jgi:hypothetical protein